MAVAELKSLRELCSQNKTRVIGLHSHVGSGIQSPETWAEIATLLASLAEDFPDVSILDLGGGLGVPERPGQIALDLKVAAEILAQFKQHHPEFKLWIEPGRFLVAEAGVLLARVTQTKTKSDRHFIGLDAGMNSLIRPPLYGAYHQIANLSRLSEPSSIVADVVGPICESGDVLGHGRQLPVSTEGDVFLLATAGAYGYSMSSHYNLRDAATEVVID
jgi:diaminopimelate decarboxylase/aspartate kinase